MVEEALGFSYGKKKDILKSDLIKSEVLKCIQTKIASLNKKMK